MVVDIVPELLELLQNDFRDKFNINKNITSLLKIINEGEPTYSEANDLSVETGDILAEVFQTNLSSDILPDGRMYYNIGKRTVEPMMIDNFNIISTNTIAVQEYLNKRAGLGIKAQLPLLNQDRIDGIIDRLDEAELFDDVKWVLGEPIINFSQAVVEDSIRENAEFHNKLGLKATITRTAETDACDWCKALEGKYQYPDVPKDVYRRHEYCRCVVEYDPGDGRKQNMWTKKTR